MGLGILLRLVVERHNLQGSLWALVCWLNSHSGKSLASTSAGYKVVHTQAPDVSRVVPHTTDWGLA